MASPSDNFFVPRREDLDSNPTVQSLMSALVHKFPDLDIMLDPNDPCLPADDTTVDFARSDPQTENEKMRLSPCVEEVPEKQIQNQSFDRLSDDSGFLSSSTPSPSSLRPPEDSYVTMIGKALMSVPEREMVLGDLYNYITEKYPYFKSAKPSWKSTVRHNLSTCQCFVRGRKARQGRGYMWGIHPMYKDHFEKGHFTLRMAKLAALQPKRRRQTKTAKHQPETAPAPASTSAQHHNNEHSSHNGLQCVYNLSQQYSTFSEIDKQRIARESCQRLYHYSYSSNQGPILPSMYNYQYTHTSMPYNR